MGHVILSGGGNEKQTKELDKFFISILPKTRRILYIPVAMPPKLHTFEECFRWFRKAMNVFGVQDITMVTNLEGITSSQLKKYSAVYIGGGNTFYLLKKIKETYFSKKLLNYLEEGGIIYGGSAGAAILGKEIGTARFGTDADKNEVHLKNRHGLDIARGFSIACHYTDADDRRIFTYVRRNRIEVIALPEETGLHIHKDKIRVIGTKPAYLFGAASKKKIAVNASF